MRALAGNEGFVVLTIISVLLLLGSLMRKVDGKMEDSGPSGSDPVDQISDDILMNIPLEEYAEPQGSTKVVH
jgi:hypothetical protein